MAYRARYVTAIVVVWGLMLGPPSMAQQADEADALNTQVLNLYGATGRTRH